ncbi:MAG: RnfABCDGE type electron transport complex subunit B [Spirochaetales bacterium]|jgi:Na+-translocating ferredoxin:NAD+ oxidoreductase subunit B|nr:RnfABCDGE type electron transport complex subunit B [Spirochaetales bacterium]
MLFLKIIWAFLSVGLLGALLGLGLYVASKFFAVKKDTRIQLVEEALPGLNCGACGFAGCESYADAIVNSNENLDLCKPGGPDSMAELGRIMGTEVDLTAAKLVAQVHCRGGKDTAQYKFNYEGLLDCNAAHQLYGGAKTCPHGCLGLGSCIKVCPVDAIEYDDIGLVWVDRNKCISCEKCVDICPTAVMKMIPYTAEVLIGCNSTDKGGVVRKYCKVGCIGCKKCEKSSPEGGFVIENFLARIDYSQGGERNSARQDCPTKCIVGTSEDSGLVEAAQPEPVAVAQDSHESD